jgi:hypothetical protein
MFFAATDLLILEIDLLFFDTTSTYFERHGPDRDIVDEDGQRGTAGVVSSRAQQGSSR